MDSVTGQKIEFVYLVEPHEICPILSRHLHEFLWAKKTGPHLYKEATANSHGTVMVHDRATHAIKCDSMRKRSISCEACCVSPITL